MAGVWTADRAGNREQAYDSVLSRCAFCWPAAQPAASHLVHEKLRRRHCLVDADRLAQLPLASDTPVSYLPVLEHGGALGEERQAAAARVSLRTSEGAAVFNSPH